MARITDVNIESIVTNEVEEGWEVRPDQARVSVRVNFSPFEEKEDLRFRLVVALLKINWALDDFDFPMVTNGTIPVIMDSSFYNALGDYQTLGWGDISNFYSQSDQLNFRDSTDVWEDHLLSKYIRPSMKQEDSDGSREFQVERGEPGFDLRTNEGPETFRAFAWVIPEITSGFLVSGTYDTTA